MKKIKLGLVFGGRSAEHEVSIMSSKSVLAVIDKDKYQVSTIFISKKGQWHVLESLDGPMPEDQSASLIDQEVMALLLDQDLVLPVIHGPFGEDGKLQGFFDTLNIQYVGSDVLSSALCMDKIVSKHLLEKEGFETAGFYSMTGTREDEMTGLIKWIDKVGYPVYIKPSNMGSSVGISKVSSLADLQPALDLALEYDSRVIIEEAISGREIECAVLEGDHLIVSGLGEVVATDDFYDYETKYVDDGKAKMAIPATNIPDNIREEIRKQAKEAFVLHGCKGLARVDFFLEDGSGRIVLNEINTLPGMTAFSMYPELFKEMGMSYRDLIDRLIESVTYK